MVLSVVIAALGATWYGPAVVSFRASFEGNPFDGLDNDVRVVFQGPAREERLAYFDKGVWKAVLVGRSPGVYKATLERNGKPVDVAPVNLTISAGAKLHDGYVRVGPKHRGFRLDSGKPYVPLGHNLGWHDDGMPELAKTLEAMGQNGLNWSRVWACSWDGKNPYWPADTTKLPLGTMWEPALANWDSVVGGADKAGVKFQFVLFHHGLFTTTVNPNWPDHPWNKAKGGFLAKPEDFFTDPQAKRLAKNWLRYAVARWGHSPSVMAWELFNEVDWVDEARNGHWDRVCAWHKEMADYLRSIDPYHHLITTSSAMDQKALWSALDYYQPHTYPPSVWGAVVAQPQPKDKPLFFGEVGAGSYDPKLERGVIRDAIWAGVLSGQAGAAQYWVWNSAGRYYSEYGHASTILAHYGADPELDSAVPVKLNVASGAMLEFSPGGGWEPTTKTEFRLPEEAKPSELKKLASYFQSQVGSHKDMCPNPLTFRFNASAPGRFSARFGQLSEGGASAKLYVNGQLAAQKVWPGGGAALESLSGEFPAGPVEVKLGNDGNDWVILESVRIDGLAPQAWGAAVGNPHRLLVRLVAAHGAHLPVSVGLSCTGLKDGVYKVRETDLDTGQMRTFGVKVKGGALSAPYELRESDVVLEVTPQKR